MPQIKGHARAQASRGGRAPGKGGSDALDQ